MTRQRHHNVRHKHHRPPRQPSPLRRPLAGVLQILAGLVVCVALHPLFGLPVVLIGIAVLATRSPLLKVVVGVEMAVFGAVTGYVMLAGFVMGFMGGAHNITSLDVLNWAGMVFFVLGGPPLALVLISWFTLASLRRDAQDRSRPDLGVLLEPRG